MADAIIGIIDIRNTTGNWHLLWFGKLLDTHFEGIIAHATHIISSGKNRRNQPNDKIVIKPIKIAKPAVLSVRKSAAGPWRPDNNGKTGPRGKILCISTLIAG